MTSSDKDKELWRQFTEDVVPKKKVKHISKPSAKQPESSTFRKQNEKQGMPMASSTVKKRDTSSDIKPKKPLQADRRHVRQVATGATPIGARLDLHGCFRDQAKAAVLQFVRKESGHSRCVLVITGKGMGREGGSVLRRGFLEWIMEPAFARYIHAFSEARPNHGGTGAFYLFLRRIG